MAPSRKYKKQNVQEIKPVTREEIETKLNEIDTIINETKSSTADATKLVIGIAVGVGIVAAFMLGKRKALRKKTLITFIKTR